MAVLLYCTSAALSMELLYVLINWLVCELFKQCCLSKCCAAGCKTQSNFKSVFRRKSKAEHTGTFILDYFRFVITNVCQFHEKKNSSDTVNTYLQCSYITLFLTL